jgi:hypothetical protein
MRKIISFPLEDLPELASLLLLDSKLSLLNILSESCFRFLGFVYSKLLEYVFFKFFSFSFVLISIFYGSLLRKKIFCCILPGIKIEIFHK